MLKVIVICLVIIFVFPRSINKNSIEAKMTENEKQFEKSKHPNTIVKSWGAFRVNKPPAVRDPIEKGEDDKKGADDKKDTTNVEDDGDEFEFQECLNQYCSRSIDECGLGCISKLNYCNKKIYQGIQAYNDCVVYNDHADNLVWCAEEYCGSI